MSTNVLIAFYSRSGVTETLAKAVAEGVRKSGAEVRMRRAREIVSPEVIAKVAGWKENRERMEREYEAPTVADAEWADAMILGTPTRFGAICAELKAYIDSLGKLWANGELNGKAAGVFCSTSTPHGGNESTLISMYNPLAHLGFVLVPTGYGHPALFRGAGTPYGASSVSANESRPPSEDDLEVARFLGDRVTRVAGAIKPLRAQVPQAA